MKKNIELYLISGFLGSGKTTFLKQLLEQNSNKKVGVIVNEFGSIGIDGKVLQKNDLELVEINNGSIFCACLKGKFVQTLVEFLNYPIDVLFVEASGMADPSSMKNLLSQLTEILKNKPEIQKEYHYKGSICLVDAARFMEFCELFQPTINQVMKSSLLILNKIDEVSEEKTEKLLSKLAELNGNAHVYSTTFGKVPLELIESKVKPEGVFYEDTTNTIQNRPITYTIDAQENYELDKMKALSLELSDQALRFKGFFKNSKGIVYHADNVGDYINFKEIINDKINNEYNLKLVLIGKSNVAFDEKIIEVWRKYFPTQTLNLTK